MDTLSSIVDGTIAVGGMVASLVVAVWAIAASDAATGISGEGVARAPGVALKKAA